MQSCPISHVFDVSCFTFFKSLHLFRLFLPWVSFESGRGGEDDHLALPSKEIMQVLYTVGEPKYTRIPYTVLYVDEPQSPLI